QGARRARQEPGDQLDDRRADERRARRGGAEGAREVGHRDGAEDGGRCGRGRRRRLPGGDGAERGDGADDLPPAQGAVQVPGDGDRGGDAAGAVPAEGGGRGGGASAGGRGAPETDREVSASERTKRGLNELGRRFGATEAGPQRVVEAFRSDRNGSPT